MDTKPSGKPGAVTQWVIFNLGNEEYGVPATQVQEVSRYASVTHVPKMPKFIKGVFNLRGKIVPLLDLKERFEIGLGAPAAEQGQRVIVSFLGEQLVGLIVDEVSGVVRFSSEAIDPVPSTLPKLDAEFLVGVGKLGERLIVLIDLAKMLNDIERKLLANMEAAGT